jgi:hypothetical protein
MTRKDLLRYLEKQHGAALAQVGLIAVDTQESLYYVIDDAMRMSNDAARKAEADRCVAQLIHDRLDALGIELETEQPQPAVELTEEIPDVSNV